MWAKLITIDFLFPLLWRIPPNTPTELLTRAILLWFPPPSGRRLHHRGWLGSPWDGAQSCCVAAPCAVHALLLPRELPGTRPAAFIFFSATIYFIPYGNISRKGLCRARNPILPWYSPGDFLRSPLLGQGPQRRFSGILMLHLPPTPPAFSCWQEQPWQHLWHTAGISGVFHIPWVSL